IREELTAGRIVIDPLDESCIQPSSVDLHIDRYFRVFRNHTMGYIDVKQDQEELTELVEIKEDDVFILHPGEFVLGSTFERVSLPDDLVARLEGKSSLGRLGLLIHSTAGFVDAGWNGHLTLELSNVANLPITLYPGMKIGQISFLRMSTAADAPLHPLAGPARAVAHATRPGARRLDDVDALETAEHLAGGEIHVVVAAEIAGVVVHAALVERGPVEVELAGGHEPLEELAVMD